MARFTSIGMPKKSFVSSAAEEAQTHTRHETDTGGPSSAPTANNSQAPPKKRKRRGTSGKIPVEGGSEPTAGVKTGWGRDPNIARRVKMSAKLSEDRRSKRQDDRNSSTTCFACRSVGHAARDCPNVLLAQEKGGEGSADVLGAVDGGEKQQGKNKGMKRKPGKKGGDVVGGKCYRCNSSEHSLGACPEPIDPTDPTPFATCYICLASGHLSALCPSNPGRGIYVNGGSCKVCNSTAHRAKDCPVEAAQKRAESNPKRPGEIVLGTAGGELGADEDDFMVDSRVYLQRGGDKEKKRRHPPANNGQRGPKAMYEKAEEGDATEPTNLSGQGEVESVSKPVAAAPKRKAKVIAF